MKKIIYLLIAICALTNLSSCTDKNDTEPEKNPDAIIGTSWKALTYQEEEFTFYGIILFNDNGKGTIKQDGYKNGVIFDTETIPFSYTYKAPNGSITANDDDGQPSTVNFTIKGNNLTLSEGGESLVFVKQ